MTRFTALLYRCHIRHDPEHPFKLQLPFPRAVGLAMLTCLAAVTLIFCGVRPRMSASEAWWVDVVVYGVVPLAVTVSTLYGAGWRRELGRGARARAVLGRALIIWGGVLAAIVFFVVVGLVYSSSMPKNGGSSQ